MNLSRHNYIVYKTSIRKFVFSISYVLFSYLKTKLIMDKKQQQLAVTGGDYSRTQCTLERD